MSDSSISRKLSNIWLHFSPQSGGKARCDICKVLLSYSGGTTSNLVKHIKAKHPSVVDDIQPKNQQPRKSSREKAKIVKYPRKMVIKKMKQLMVVWHRQLEWLTFHRKQARMK